MNLAFIATLTATGSFPWLPSASSGFLSRGNRTGVTDRAYLTVAQVIPSALQPLRRGETPRFCPCPENLTATLTATGFLGGAF